jgi:hypothetical protein
VKRLCVAVSMMLSSLVLAQEIGTEITPVTPDSKPKPVNQPNENPYAPPPASPEPKETAHAAKQVDNGPRSAEKGAFGIRATFNGQVVGSSRVGMGAGPIETGSIGLGFWASDSLTLLFDLGLGLGISGSGANIGFGAGIGIDYHFRTAADALRPLFHIQVGIGSAIAPDIGSALSLGAQVGGGAEYFFSPNFSLTGRVALGLRLPLGFGQAIVLTTLTPAVGAAWYF